MAFISQSQLLSKTIMQTVYTVIPQN